MSCAVSIVFRFGAFCEAGETAKLTNRIQSLCAAGEYFVDVALVRNIKENFVLRSFKNAVQGNAKFDNTKVRSQVPTGVGERANELLTYFYRKPWQTVLRQGFYICWRVDTCQQTLAPLLIAGRIHRRSAGQVAEE